MRVLRAVATLLLIPLGPFTAHTGFAQGGQPPVFRSGASLVALNVTVLDHQKRFVTGLGAQDFTVLEDGVPQRVEFFEAQAVPIDLILLLDTSASMRHRLEFVHQAALGFIRTLRNGDRGAIVAFNDNVEVLEPLTGDRAKLEAAIRSTTASGGTALHNAVYIALKQFAQPARNNMEIRRQALALLSDGADTASLIAFEDVLELARRSGVSIYPIALTDDDEERGAGGKFSPSLYSLRQLAKDTGAQAFFLQKVHELGGIYGSIADELANQYSIAYTPSNRAVDGRFRKIMVRVASRPECSLRARSGYIAGRVSGAAFIH